MSTLSEDPKPWEISFLDQQNFDAVTTAIVISIMMNNGWTLGEIEKRIDWKSGRLGQSERSLEKWIAKENKDVAECCQVLLAVLREIGKAPVRTVEPAGVEISDDLLTSPATSPKYPDYDTSQQVAEVGFDPAKTLQKKQLISLKASFAGVLETIRSDPEGGKGIAESARRMLERLVEVAGRK